LKKNQFHDINMENQPEPWKWNTAAIIHSGGGRIYSCWGV